MNEANWHPDRSGKLYGCPVCDIQVLFKWEECPNCGSMRHPYIAGKMPNPNHKPPWIVRNEVPQI